MFDYPEFPHSLDENTFESWLERGRASKIPYTFILIFWDERQLRFFPEYVESRDEIELNFGDSVTAYDQRLIAVYDIFSGTRIR